MIKCRYIDGYEGMYTITENGIVKSCERKVHRLSSKGNESPLFVNERNIKQHLSYSGYLCFSLSKNNKSKQYEVHRALAISFIPNPLNLAQVNHINGIKTDNRLENLEWVSRRENITHAAIMRKKTSKYVGVCWGKHSKMWVSQAKLNKKLYHLGYFKNEIDASRAYLEFLKTHNIKNKYNNTPY